MFQRFFLFFFAAVAGLLPIAAQTYERQWQAVETAADNDLPKTALKHVRDIRTRATRDKNAPQLLRALLTEAVMQQEIAPDSGKEALPLIETAMTQETRPVEHALWQYALGRLLLMQNRSDYDGDTLDRHRGSTLLLAALADVERLGRARTTDYLPLFDLGKDSRSFYRDDLLSALLLPIEEEGGIYFLPEAAQEDYQGVLRRAVDFYKREGNRRAALQMELALTRKASMSAEKWQALHDQYIDLSENAQTSLQLAIHLWDNGKKAEAVALAKADLARYGQKAGAPLFNILQDWQQPYAELSFERQNAAEMKRGAAEDDSERLYPGAAHRLQLSWRNVKQVEVRFHRLVGMRGNDARLKDVYGKDAMLRLLSRCKSVQALTIRPTLTPTPDYLKRKDSMAFTCPEAGIYVVQLMVDGKCQDADLYRIATTARLDFSAKSWKGRLHRTRFVDFITGNPATAAADSIYLAPVQQDDWRRNNDLHYGRVHYTRARIFTDRAIYRPGQRVEISGVVFQRNADHYRVFPAWKGRFVVFDSQAKALDTLQVVSDSLGTVVATYTLPKYVRPGNFYLRLFGEEISSVQHSFRVEEYKRPTFHVELDTLAASVRLGDRIRLRGHVRAFNGVPIVGAQVKWRKTARALWSWRDEEEMSSDSTFSSEGTLTTNEAGDFDIATTLGTAATTEGESLVFTFTAEVLAGNGETQRASRSAVVGDSTDERPTAPQPIEVSGDGSEEATVRVNRPCFLFYDLVSIDNGLEESRVMEVTEPQTFTLRWKTAYGDAATAHFAFLQNGVLTYRTATVERQKPDKKLRMEWGTFRSHLQPGSTEEWTLRVLRPDGTPARANVMAHLYDASLDAFAKSSWTPFTHTFWRSRPVGYWQQQSVYTPSFSFWHDTHHRELPTYDFTQWKPMMFDYSGSRVSAYMLNEKISIASLEVPVSKMMGKMRIRGTANIADLADEQLVGGATQESAAEEEETAPTVQLRQNFNETAFFFPRLHTDAQGVVTLRFTLPESLTQWNFDAFAHDAQFNTGLLSDKVVVRKLLSAEAALPRFLREGDRTEIPITVRNLSEKRAQGKVFLTLVDAETQRTLKTLSQKFDLAAGAALHHAFAYEVPDGLSRIVARVVAKSTEFSDGEERELPILSRRIELTHAVPFTVKRGENYDAQLAAARKQLLAALERGVQPQLAVDTCRDARTEVAKVVPQLLKMADNGSATDIATALYGLEIGAMLRPYTQLTDEEINVRRENLIARLAQQQQREGGWSWWSGMKPSPWITSEIATLLGRINTLTGRTETDAMLQRALHYLDQVTQESVAEMRKHPNTGISEWHFRYLYLHRILRRADTDEVRYLLRLAAKKRKELSMYGKSGVAVILAGTPHDAEARLALQSLIEHTVVSEEMGRSFDTERAFSGWASYRIPTQTFAIEALQRLASPTAQIDNVTVADLVSEMKLWLLQSKRTQTWNSSRATADATYALLREPDAANEGLTWGAVSARYTLPAAQAVQKGSGFTLVRRLEVLRGKQWQRIESDGRQTLRVGDHVRWVYEITADRDYDHVALRSTRPACFETLRPLSGYTWLDGLGAYRMVRDSENEYFIEHLAKGRHTFTDEMIVDRAGTYDAGLSRIECVFSPEFVANSSPDVFTVLPAAQ